MNRENETQETGAVESPREDPLGIEEEPDEDPGRPSPTWRGLVIAVAAAIVLSVSATLLLGGSFLQDGGASAAGCGPGSACCPPAAQER